MILLKHIILPLLLALSYNGLLLTIGIFWFQSGSVAIEGIRIPTLSQLGAQQDKIFLIMTEIAAAMLILAFVRIFLLGFDAQILISIWFVVMLAFCPIAAFCLVAIGKVNTFDQHEWNRAAVTGFLISSVCTCIAQVCSLRAYWNSLETPAFNRVISLTPFQLQLFHTLKWFKVIIAVFLIFSLLCYIPLNQACASIYFPSCQDVILTSNIFEWCLFIGLGVFFSTLPADIFLIIKHKQNRAESPSHFQRQL